MDPPASSLRPRTSARSATPSPSPPPAPGGRRGGERRVAADLSSTSPLSAAARIRHVLAGSRVMRVLILSSDTGGGHRASAAALKSALLHMYPGRLRVHTADFWVDFARGTFAAMPDQYAFLAKHPLLWKLSYECMRFPPVRAAAEVSFNALAHNNIKSSFQKFAPDLIISVHPLVNTLALRVLKALQDKTGVPRCAYATVVTDLGGCHPTWMHRGVDALYVPTDAVAAVAARVGVPSDRVRQYGLPTRKDFWSPEQCAAFAGLTDADASPSGAPPLPKPPTREQLRVKLGMRVGLTSILFVGGGDGVGRLGPVTRSVAAKIARDHGPDGAQLVVVCGKNAQLVDELNRHRWGLPTIVNGFVDNMSEWMTACDVLCTKAGPGTIAEGLVCGLPILISGFLPGQEEANVSYIVEKKAGEYASRPAKIAAIASRWVADPDALAAMSAAARAEARPQATLEIAADVWDVATTKMADTATWLEHRQKIRAAQASLARSHLLNAAAAAGGAGSLALVSNSQLLLRVRVLLRVVFGGVIVAEAAGYRMPSSRRR
jgi:1,2-diacylglycerol 3-beta-galactosyltransferase